MNTRNLRETPRSLRPLIIAALALASGGCADPNVFLPSYQPGGPQGIISGSVTYAGPLPCTEDGQIVEEVPIPLENAPKLSRHRKDALRWQTRDSSKAPASRNARPEVM